MVSWRRALVLGGIVLGGLGTPCLADEWDTFNFYARSAYQYDSNIFRNPGDDGSQAVGDHITSVTGGLKIDRSFGQQRLRADGSITDDNYATFSFLDGSTRDYLVAWDWSLSPRLTGTIAIDQDESPADPDSFDEEIRNIRTVRTQRLEASWWLHSNWFLLAEVGKEKRLYDSPTDEDRSFTAERWAGGLRYESGAGRRITAMYRHRDGNYDDDRTVNQAMFRDDSFETKEYEVALVYPFGGKTRLRAQLGYVDQSYPHVSELDFSGLTGGLNLEWGLTAKLDLNAGYRHDRQNWQTGNGSYAVIDGWTIGAIWAYTAKQKLNLLLEALHKQQRGALDLSPPEALRNDHTRKATLSWIWTPTLTTEVTASAMYGRRDSDDDDHDYYVHGLSLSVQQMF